MFTSIGWSEIALRLLLTVIAGAVIGFDRGSHGRPAGLRTTLLVCLAASIAMIQTNLLLGTAGKRPDSFVVLDLMRLPLGILSGMGFIGAGAIIRRGNLVVGVTTAATLWFSTVMGLCFGGGQLALGLVSLGLGFLTLSGLKLVEQSLKRIHRATLTVMTDYNGLGEQEITRYFVEAGYKISNVALNYSVNTHRILRYEVRWSSSGKEFHTPVLVEELARRPGIQSLSWKPALAEE